MTTLSLVLGRQFELRYPKLYSHDVDDGSPAAEGITVDGVKEHLGDSLKQVLGLEVRLPQSLSSSVQLLGRGSCDSEVFGSGDAADADG